jgi:hypothetical protein
LRNHLIDIANEFDPPDRRGSEPIAHIRQFYGARAPLTTTDDVGSFVSSHMSQLFDRAGLKTVDSDAPVTIKGEVRQFFARETSTYNSQVEVRLTLVDRDGNTIWKGLASGEATRFGRSYRIENYYEVLSDAVVNTVSSLLRSAEFRKALSRR